MPDEALELCRCGHAHAHRIGSAVEEEPVYIQTEVCHLCVVLPCIHFVPASLGWPIAQETGR